MNKLTEIMAIVIVKRSHAFALNGLVRFPKEIAIFGAFERNFISQ